VYKKIAAILFTTILLASCGAGRNTVTNKNYYTSTQNDLISYSRKFIGKPYRSAGKGPGSFDCSGFTSFVFREFGYKLNSSSEGQDKQFPTIKNTKDLKKGDLVFFEGRRGDDRVGHVGIVTENRSDGTFRFIHASTNYGVIVSSSTEPYYASRYLRGGRVLEETSDMLKVQTGYRTNKDEYDPFVPAAVSTKLSTAEGNTHQEVILIQNDPEKNFPLEESQAANKEKEQRKEPTSRTRNDVILGRDPADIPDPEMVDVE
jgi:hypothetical protein